MSTLKDFRFKVDAAALPRRRVRVRSGEKPELIAVTPPEFKDGTPGLWSPEDLLVASVASCYALTFDAIAERGSVPVRNLAVTGVGHMTRRADDKLGFVVFELRVTLTTDDGFVPDVERMAHRAEEACLIARALEVPVEVELDIVVEAGVPLVAG